MNDLKEAKFYDKLDNNKVLCKLCYRNCVILENQLGFCKVRKNINGKLYSLNYNLPIAINIDPIEKKPINNFLKNTYTLSYGCLGCNFDCKFCQNYTISKEFNQDDFKDIKKIEPKEIIDFAKQNNLLSISHTYTEPTVFFEYAYEILKLAKQNNLKNIWVTNGYMQKEVIEKISKYLDAVNIDYKGDFNFYKTLITNIDLKKIQENIELFYKKNIHIEITYLLIEEYNTNEKQISEFIDFIKNISKEIPIHFTSSYGCYKLKDINPTTINTLNKAKKIAKDKGMIFVY